MISKINLRMKTLGLLIVLLIGFNFVNAQNKVERRQFKTGRAIGDAWLVSEGLKAGDRVIVEGLQKVRPGAIVVATPAKVPVAANPAAR